MDTQVINNGGKNAKVADALKKAAPLAGGVIAGAGTFAATEAINGQDEELQVVDPATVTTENNQEKPDEKETPAEQQQTTQTTTHPENNTSQTTNEHQPQVNQPTQQNNQGGSQGGNQGNNQGGNQGDNPGGTDIQTSDIPDVDPNIVAQEIITDDVIMVDPEDNDLANMTITSVGTVETVDGQLLTAAQLTGEDGSNVYMVDIDGDNTYDLVQDESGSILGDIPTTLTVSDSESIADIGNQETGYLASTDTDASDIADNDNPMEDVINLG